MPLSETVPAWARDYIDIDFVDRGRTREGLDCWGLVRLVYAERFGVLLPSLQDRYRDAQDGPCIADLCRTQMPDWRLLEAPRARVGDVALFRVAGEPWHVGVLVARGRMLHAQRGTRSCIERIDTTGWGPRLEGLFRFAGPVQMITSAWPFGVEHRRERPEGLTITELLEAEGVKPLPGLRVCIGDHEVPRDAWGFVKPKAGRVVFVKAIPAGGSAGGGKDTIRIVLQIAIVVAAIGITVGTAGVLGQFGAAVAGAAFSIGASLAINALIPPPKPRLTEGTGQTTSPSITGARNELRPYGAIPVPFGRHRIAPPYGGVPYTEAAGDDQYLRLLFALGYGPLDIADLKIGETPLDEFEGVEVETRTGRAGENPTAIYPGTVIEEGLSILLPFNEQIVRTSQLDAEELSIELVFPQGLTILDAAGQRLNRTVAVDVEYSPAGMNDWRTINATTTWPGSTRGMDFLFRTPEVTQGGNGVIVYGPTGQFSFGSLFGRPQLAFTPATNYSLEIFGYVLAPTAGLYRFGIDCFNGGDITIDGQVVASRYNRPFSGTTGPVPDFTTNNGSISLTAGYHTIRIRMEAHDGQPGALAIGWQLPGSSTWAEIPVSNLSTGTTAQGTTVLSYRWFDITTYTSSLVITAARTEALRRTFSWPVARGQYDVRLRRVTSEDLAGVPADRLIDDVYWSAIRTIRSDDPIAVPSVARVALRIKATDQLNGVVDQFNAVVTSVLPDWDSATQTWIERATSNPASIYRAILQGPANARPVADARIDLAELQAWHEACELEGFEFNGIFDTPGTVYERLADVAASGRASFAMRDGKYSVVRDRVQTVPVQHFTPRNTTGFKGTKAFADLPHALRVGFMNADKNWQRDERVVLADGYQIGGRDAWGVEAPTLPSATRYETIEFFGVTDPEQVFRHARYHLAVAKLRPEVYEIGTDVEHIACTRGDLVLVTHDVPLWGGGSGRVLGLVLNDAGGLLGLHLDEAVEFAEGKNYRIRVRLEDGTSFVRDVMNQTAPATEIRFSAGAVDSSEARPAVGDLWMFGELGRESIELVVKSIDVEPDLSATITLVDHAPAVHSADVGAVPAFDPGLSLPPDWLRTPPAPVFDTIRSDELVMTRDAAGRLRPRVLAAITQAGGAVPMTTSLQGRFRPLNPDGTATGPWIYTAAAIGSPREIAFEPVAEGVTYQLAVRAVASNGSTSTWTQTSHLVIGQSTPPPAPETFSVVRLADGMRRYSWTLGTVPPDVTGVMIRAGESWQTWDQMTALHAGPLAGTSTDMNVPGSGAWTFRIRTIDAAGNLSATDLQVAATLGPPSTEDAAFIKDERFDGFAGTKTLCTVSGGGDLEADATAPGGWESPIVYESKALDAGAAIEFSPGLYASGDGFLTLEVAWSDDDVTYTDWVMVSAIAGQVVTARYLKARVTVETNGTYPRPVLRELQLMMRAAVVEHRIVNLDTSSLPAALIIKTGDVRLPIPAGRMAVVRSIQIAHVGDGQRGAWEVIDRTASPGPRIQMYDSAGVMAHRTIDAVIRGFGGSAASAGGGGSGGGGGGGGSSWS